MRAMTDFGHTHGERAYPFWRIRRVLSFLAAKRLHDNVTASRLSV